MQRLYVLLVASLVAFVGCKKADSFARVTVSSTSTLAAVARLHVSATIAGASSQFDVHGGADSGTTFTIPPSRVFGLQIPATYGGTLMLHVDAYDDADSLLAGGDGQIDIAAGQSRDVDVVLGAADVDMGGPDLSAAGAVLSLTPPSFVFPLTDEGTTGSTTTFTLKNTGDQTTAILPLPVLQGAMPASFSISSTDCQGAQLAPGAFCSVSVLYAPKSAGKISAVLAVGSAMSTIDATSLGNWKVEVAPVVPDLSGGSTGMATNTLCVWGSAAGDVYAGNSQGEILHRSTQGTWLGVQYVGQPVNVNGIWGSSATDVYAVGAATTIWYFNGGTWTNLSSTVNATAHPNFFAVNGTAKSNLFLGGDGNIGVMTSSGNQTFADDTASPQGPVTALWADPASGDLYAIAGANINHRHNATWTTFVAAAPLHGIWGTSATNVYVVGDGVIYRFDGTGVHGPTNQPNVTYHGVWGTADDDVFAVGDAGTILHSSGNDVWTAQTSNTTQQLSAVWGSGTGDVYVVGSLQVVLHYN